MIRTLTQANTLHGKSVYLRKPTYEELSYIGKLWADEETMKDIGGPYLDFGPEKAERWYMFRTTRERMYSWSA